MVDLKRYGFDGDYQAIYDMVDRYGRKELYPLSEEMDREDWFPIEEYRKMASLGILGVTVPEKFGGAGMDEIAQCLVAEAMSKWNSSMGANYIASDNLCINNILRNGNDPIREKYLPKY